MEFVEYESRNRIGYITLNRPDKRNALNYDVVTDLKEAFSIAESDLNSKVIVLKAEGKVFCAGADLEYVQQLQSNTYEENLKDSSHLRDLFYQIYTNKKVVVAQIQGHALAGGSGLAALCDFSFSVPKALFGYTEVRIGFIPALVMVFLIRKIGEGKAKELLLSGDLVTADQAKQMGMINRVVEEEKLESTVKDFCDKLISQNSGESMAATKKMIAEVQSMTLDEALTHAAEINAKTRETEDCRRGIDAFLNKEDISW